MMHVMLRDSKGSSLVEAMAAVAVLCVSLSTVGQFMTFGRKALVVPLRKWQSQLALQSVADTISALSLTSWKSLLSLNTGGLTQYDKTNQTWLQGWEGNGATNVRFTLSLSKNGGTCNYPLIGVCTPSPVSEDLKGWTKRIQVTAQFRGSATAAVETLTWSKSIPPAF
jgi:hypothetical protein